APRSAAVHTRFREHHVAARRFRDAAAQTVGTPALRRAQKAKAPARPALLLPGDGELAVAAAHRILEAQGEDVMQVDAAVDRLVGSSRAALAKNVCKEIAEGGRRFAADGRREIEPFEPERR